MAPRYFFLLHISSSWVNIRLHTENQLPRLPGSALKVPGGGGGVVGSYPLLSQAPTPVEVELGCDNMCSINYSQLAGNNSLVWIHYILMVRP
jgi:hypothetical protein